MGPRLFLILCFSTLAVAALGAVAVGAWLIAARLPDVAPVGGGAQLTDIVIVYGGGVACLLGAGIAVLWAYLDHAIAQPLSQLLRGIQTVVHANPDHRIEVNDTHQLGALPVAIRDLVRRLAIAQSNVNETVATATASIEAERNRLGAILQDLHEGVIVCTPQHRILLYNTRALQILHIGGDIGLDRSLFHFITRLPIVHALGRLTSRLADGRFHESADASRVPFVGATVDGRYTLEGRMSLFLDADGGITGYVISFEDNTDELAALGLRDRLLREATEGLRAPVASLRAAAEIIGGGGLSDSEQQAFKQVVVSESQALAERLDALAARYRDIITGHWPMSDIYSSNLFNNVAGRLKERRDIQAIIVGIPQWLFGDSYTLVQTLDRLIGHASDETGAKVFDLEAVAGEKRVYLDVAWQGPVIAAATLHGWLGDRLEDALGDLTVSDVLERHKTDVWSLAGRDGRARLRLPLPPSVKIGSGQDVPPLPPRPEFYDFDLFQRGHDLGALGQQSLRSLTYVAFDTETTGLEPSSGDEIVAIAGVRIVNGRILTGESFERIVDPQRPIPRESTRFHGITENMVKDKPPVQIVLPQFRAFVGNAVLIAHNAAFDLKFIKLKEGESAISFDMPVLDTLLLSMFVHDHMTRHNLDAVAERFGVPVHGRHTALGDALVTAGVFLKMIDVLEARGIVTLDQAMAAAHSIVEVRAKQAAI
jgi:DNA polymerase-3 subunit epsilon